MRARAIPAQGRLRGKSIRSVPPKPVSTIPAWICDRPARWTGDAAFGPDPAQLHSEDGQGWRNWRHTGAEAEADREGVGVGLLEVDLGIDAKDRATKPASAVESEPLPAMVMPLKLMPLDRKITKEEAKASDQPMLKKGALRKGLTKAGQSFKPNRWQTTQGDPMATPESDVVGYRLERE